MKKSEVKSFGKPDEAMMRGLRGRNLRLSWIFKEWLITRKKCRLF
jgi:hypothetical protein